MTENNRKTTVTITHPDGMVKTYSADTVICFTVDKVKEFLEGDAKAIESTVSYVGAAIPEVIFEKTIASLVASFIEKDYEDKPLMAGFTLFDVAERLQKREKEIRDSMSEEEFLAASSDILRNYLGDMLEDIEK